MSTPSDPSDPSDRPRRNAEPAPGTLESELDEALEETFPASDPINLHQWTELEQEEAEREPKKDESKAKKAEAEPDRESLYLRGPTAYCA
jgi:hypothetical protein